MNGYTKPAVIASYAIGDLVADALACNAYIAGI
jgi:hypothetical protein